MSREDTLAFIWKALLGELFIVHQSEEADMWDEIWPQCMFVDKSWGTWAELEQILDLPKDKFDAQIALDCFEGRLISQQE